MTKTNNAMRTLYLILCLTISFLGCKKSTDDPVATSTASTYFIEVTADGVVYNFDGSSALVNNTISNIKYPYFEISTENKDNTSSLNFMTTGNLSGQPQTLPISGGSFYKNRFELYGTNSQPSNGVCTITKVDNNEVEGTFYFDVNSGTKKLSLTNGKFKLKFTR